MERVEGIGIADWVGSLRGRGHAARLRRVLLEILESCRQLDAGGIDHGELSMASKHVLVDSNDVPTIIDFESASAARRASNVTSTAQALFIGASLSERVRRAAQFPNRRAVIGLLRAYKSSPSDDTFGDLVGGLGL